MEGLTIGRDTLTYRYSDYPLKDARAFVDHGANISARMTATRVVAGGVLLGPLGAVLGGMAKKDRAKVYLVVEFPNEEALLIETKAKHEKDAREFATRINSAALSARERAERPEAAQRQPAKKAAPGWYKFGDKLRYFDGEVYTKKTKKLPNA